MSQIEHRRRQAAARSSFDPTFTPLGGRRPEPATGPVPEPAAPVPQLAPGAAEILAQAAGGGARPDEGDGFDLSAIASVPNPDGLDPTRDRTTRAILAQEDQRFLDAVQSAVAEDGTEVRVENPMKE